MRATLTIAAIGVATLDLIAQQAAFEGRPAVHIANDKLDVTVLPQGTMIAGVVLKDDPSATSPLWNPARMAREASLRSPFGDVTGHFLCVDGFGGVSKEEAAAGLPSHGEAHTKEFSVNSTQGSLSMATDLPIAQEHVLRTLKLQDGEQAIRN